MAWRGLPTNPGHSDFGSPRGDPFGPHPAYACLRHSAACRGLPMNLLRSHLGQADLRGPRVRDMLHTRYKSLMTRAPRRLRPGLAAPECARYTTCALQKLNDACAQVMTTWAPRGEHLSCVTSGVTPCPAGHRPPDHKGWASARPARGLRPAPAPGAPSRGCPATRPTQPAPNSGGVGRSP